MSVILAILAALGWLLVGLLGLLVLVLALPFHMKALGAVDSEQEAMSLPVSAWAAVRGSWAWGVLSVAWSTDRGGELRLLGLRVLRITGDEKDPEEKAHNKREKKEQKKRDKAEREKKKRDKAQKAKAKGKPRRSYSARWGLRHRATMQRIAGRLWRALRLRLTLAGALGLGDPADTVALAEALRWMHRALPGTRMDIAIDYLEELVVLDGALTGRVWLPHLAGIALTELPRREVRDMLAGR